MSIKTFTKSELNEILKKHTLWLICDPNGSKANLSEANLSRADLRETDLSGADLSEANFYRANLSRADLHGAKNLICPIMCPEEGSFIGFKKARGDYIVKLEIPEDALRCSATGRKCRCSKAKVLSITDIDGTEANATEVFSKYDPSFVYRVGEIVSVNNFEPNRWKECAPGIHFFITRQEAVEY